MNVRLRKYNSRKFQVVLWNILTISCLLMKGGNIMEFKKGDKTVSVPVLGFIAAASVVGVVATEICKVAVSKKTSK